MAKILVNQGEEAFEGLKAKKTVKITKANMNPYPKNMVRVLTTKNKLANFEISAPLLSGRYFVP